VPFVSPRDSTRGAVASSGSHTGRPMVGRVIALFEKVSALTTSYVGSITIYLPSIFGFCDIELKD
jgi:hypothetical protein